MKKTEIIWRELLYQALEKRKRVFTQKDLAQKFGFSLSTVFNALKIPRETGAIKVTGRNFKLEDPEKLLYIWGTFRSLKKDIIYQTHSSLSPIKIEKSMPPKIIYGTYSAYQQKFKQTPADYDHIYVYASPTALKEIKKRFSPSKKPANLFVLKADSFLKKYGLSTTIGQTFVDLWNLPEWYAQDFLGALKEKINGILA